MIHIFMGKSFLRNLHVLLSTHSDLDDIPCNVSCPSLYSYDNSSCTVSWTKPLNASCDVLSGYTVIISGNGMSTGSPMLDIDTITYITGRLEAFQSYTASVIATSTCGSTQPINVAFMTSREQSKHVYLPLKHNYHQLYSGT